MNRPLKSTLVLIAALALFMTTGCDRRMWGTNTASAVAGWILGSLNSPVENQCFQNGVLIDCADLPADLLQ